MSELEQANRAMRKDTISTLFIDPVGRLKQVEPGPKSLPPARALGITCLLAFLAILATACSSLLPLPQEVSPTIGPTVTPEPEPTDTPDPGITSLTFWQPYALDRPQGILLSEMIRDFEAENPDISVDIVPKSGYVGIHGSMLARLPDGELPDLTVAFPSMIAEYAAAGVVTPLDAYINDPELGLTVTEMADIYPGFLDSGRLAGYGRQILAFPFSQNAIGMWVNETLLKQAGWDHVPATWAEFEQACFDVAASAGTACYPFVESVSTFNAWLYSRGGQQLDPSGQRATFNEPPGVESLILLRRLMDVGLAWRPEEPYGDYVAFANGQAAFTFSSTGNSQLYLDAYDGALRSGLSPFQWRQTTIPQSDPANPATALYGANFVILQTGSARQEAAWRLVRWFTSPQQTARWAAELQSMPVRLSALDWMTDTLTTYPFFQDQVKKIVPHARPEPAVATGLEIRDLLYTAILSVTQGYADPQTALDQAARDANTILSGQR